MFKLVEVIELRPDKREALLVEFSDADGDVRYRVVLRDRMPPGFGDTSKVALTDFAERLEQLARRVREVIST